jgi:hypothetical protein
MHVTFESETSHKVVHPVQAPEDGALSTSRWSDECRDGMFANRDYGVSHGAKGSVVQLTDITVDDDLASVCGVIST